MHRPVKSCCWSVQTDRRTDVEMNQFFFKLQRGESGEKLGGISSVCLMIEMMRPANIELC